MDGWIGGWMDWEIGGGRSLRQAGAGGTSCLAVVGGWRFMLAGDDYCFTTLYYSYEQTRTGGKSFKEF